MLRLVTKKDIETTTQLQKICVDVYIKVSSKLKAGMSEFDIASLVEKELLKKGIHEYCYKIPILVLIGVERFKDVANSNYSIKSPSPEIVLNDGDVIYIDMHPMDSLSKRWGDWNTMAVFHPQENDEEQIAFLGLMRRILHDGIRSISSKMCGADVFNYYLNRFKEHTITLLDVRNNVGHSMHRGENSLSSRKFLDKNNHSTVAGGIYAVEPGGFRPKQNGHGIVVGRFEECIFVPIRGKAVLLGENKILPFTI